MTSSSSELFAGLFPSVPGPVRDFLRAALQLRDLEDLHARARLQSETPLSCAVLDLLRVGIRVAAQELERIPTAGPLMIVANHPFGILDGLMLDAILFRVRRDVKILSNSLVACAEEIRERLIPVDVLSRATSPLNLRSVRRSAEWLREGHAIAIFPAGEVSHWTPKQRCISDPAWSTLAARLALLSNAAVVPVYFAGANSFAFQVAGLVHPRLRTVRLPRELLNKTGSNVDIHIGHAITPPELAKQGSAENTTVYLRVRTYMLGHGKPPSRNPRPLGIVPPAPSAPSIPVAAEIPGLENEIARLEANACKILENGSYTVFAGRGETMPVVLHEIGRLRELTFRAVGEGTGRALDLDSFDPYYTHLALWHKQRRCIAGGYRLAWTEDVLPGRGMQALYTSTLFRFSPAFFRTMGPAVELGRTFIRAEFQKDYAPLLLLWQAIGRCVARRPRAPVLFGAVSISANYSPAAMELMVEYLKQRRLRPDLARLVTPRRPFRSRLTRASEIRLAAACLSEIEDLAVLLGELEDSSEIPVLLRQYVRLGGRVAAFNVDRSFSNVLDGLLVVDLRETAPKLLAKYMGAESAAAFLRDTCGARSA